MRAAVVTRKGGPEVLEIRELPEPEPGPGQVRVRVKAIGLNFADVLMRLGVYTGTPGYAVRPRARVLRSHRKSGRRRGRVPGRRARHGRDQVREPRRTRDP